MGWEKRGNHRYYYKKTRDGDEVTSEYVGRGPQAELTAAMDEVLGNQNDLIQLGFDQFNRETEEPARTLDALEALLRALRDATLYVIGFHKHKGQWRRRRHAYTDGGPVSFPLSPSPKPNHLMSEDQIFRTLRGADAMVQSAFNEAAQLNVIAERIKESDGENNPYLQMMRDRLDHHPAGWMLAGDLVYQAAEELVELVAAEEPDVKDCLLNLLEHVRFALGRDESAPLEQMLIDQLALAWLHYQITHHIFSSISYQQKKKTFKNTDYWEERLERAERRTQRATKTLARTRKIVRSTKKAQAAYAEQQASCSIDVPVGAPEGPPPSHLLPAKTVAVEHRRQQRRERMHERWRTYRRHYEPDGWSPEDYDMFVEGSLDDSMRPPRQDETD